MAEEEIEKASHPTVFILAMKQAIKGDDGLRTKNIQTENPMENTLLVGILLALVGGFLDAHTFVFRDGVLANAQTGNIVFFCISLAEGAFKKCFYYALPIAFYFLGIVFVEYSKKLLLRLHIHNWELIIVLFKIIFLFLLGFLPKEVPDLYITVSISFLCAMQIHTFKRLKGMPYATTMCTGNLRSAAEHFYHFIDGMDWEYGKKSVHYFIIIISFGIGVILGVFFTNRLGARALWVCSFLLIIVEVLCFFFYKRKPQASA